MSDLVSALDGAEFEGFARVREERLRGMITLRGDLSEPKLAAAVKKVSGMGVPAPRAIEMKGDKGVAWMSPDELLILLPYGAAEKGVEILSSGLKGIHFLAVNVSDARAVFTVSGPAAREVIAKLSPADISPASFQMGEIRRSRLAQIAAAFWMRDQETFEIVCFRSVADYVFNLLKSSAKPGSEVGYFQD